MQRTILVVASDFHGGQRHGLLNPETILSEFDEQGNWIEDYKPPLNAVQEYLWKIYKAQIDWIKEMSKTDEVILCLNGDMTAGNIHKEMLVSDRMADQIIIGRYNIEPWFELPNLKAIRYIKGTGVHVFGDGSAEILLSELSKGFHPEVSCKVADHELITIDGMDVDVSHHGPPPGSRRWLEGNECRYYLRDLMLSEFQAGKIPPRVIYRGHYHTYIQESLTIRWEGKFHTSTIILTPSFTFPNNYARKVVRSPSRITHGMVVLEIINGKPAEFYPLVKTIDIRTKEII